MIINYITRTAITHIIRDIASNNGNEVFFNGKTDKNGKVHTVEAFAWGNDISVPAIIRELKPGDVVLHNHPSGGITPSDADIQIASIVSNRGAGFYIIDNAVKNLHIVVNPFTPVKRNLLDPDAIAQMLGLDSIIARTLPEYESRPCQIDMTQAVTNCFNNGTVGLIEAGTGTGKTLAYLIPAIHWALVNDERIVVSTNTINLQEQLILKDLPLLKRCMDKEFTAVLMKGRNNYCCLRKADAEEKDLGLFQDGAIADNDFNELITLIKWSKTTKDGSLSDLHFIPKTDVWDRLKCESDACTGVLCPFYEHCFLVFARREAALADILIINHHLLFADLSLRGSLGTLADIAVLPPYTRIIIDEAHNIEEAATDYFGSTVSHYGVKRLFGRLIHLTKKGERKGLLPSLLARLADVKEKPHRQKLHSLRLQVEQELITDIFDITELSDEAFDDCAVYLRKKSGESPDTNQYLFDERFAEDTEWTELILLKFQSLINRIQECKTKLFKLAEALGDLNLLLNLSLENRLIELSAYVRRIGETAETLNYLLFESDESVVKWIEFSEKRQAVSIRSAPISVGESLRKALFKPYDTVILTSATLTVAGTFNFIKSRLGIDQLEPSRLTEQSFPSPFDYYNNVLIGIPTDIYPPDHPLFISSVRPIIAKSLTITHGRAFVLFTSYSALKDAYNYCSAELAGTQIKLLKQGDDTRHSLINRFRRESGSVLFATSSFWEGVDVIGEALESIIIARLPFRVPTEPIEIARREAIDKAGGNSFFEYTVPHAVIKFKQGFGRLIRHKNDRGTLLVLDSRVITKSYGRTFLESLPKCKIVSGNSESVFKEFKKFYK
jgi:ATP-dependent DNA helicase DinG